MWIVLVGKVFVLGWSTHGKRVRPSWLETQEYWEEAAEISLYRLGGAR